jgi:hypothetical protein
MFQILFCGLHNYFLLWLHGMYENCPDVSFSAARLKSCRIRELTSRLFHIECLQFYSSSIYIEFFRKATLAHESRAIIYQTTRRHTPEDSDRNIHHHETLNLIALSSSLDFFISSTVIWVCISLHQHGDACLFTQLEPQRSTEKFLLYFDTKLYFAQEWSKYQH